jgi:hypothetical protein
VAFAFFKDLTWTVVVALALILGVCCFFAVIWSKREWNSRKIRVGMFLEREYQHDRDEEMEPGPPPGPPAPPPADEAPTKEMRKDVW